MTVYLLDTDIITLFQFGHAKVVARVGLYPVDEIALPVIALQEQMRGWLSRLGRLSAPSQLGDWYDRLVNRIFPVWRQYRVLSFSEPSIQRFEQLRALGLNVGPMDLRIAAIALENGLTVVTRNLRDFGRVPGLTTQD